MAIMKIVKYPDPLLRQIAAPIHDITPQIRQLATDMFDTMYDAPGIGLAGNQVGQPLQIFVFDIREIQPSEDPRDTRPDSLMPQAVLNPTIVRKSGKQRNDEGCLSLPGFEEPIDRAKEITVLGVNLDGTPFQQTLRGFAAAVFQHEIDHLSGVMIIDYVSKMKRRLYDESITA